MTHPMKKQLRRQTAWAACLLRVEFLTLPWGQQNCYSWGKLGLLRCQEGEGLLKSLRASVLVPLPLLCRQQEGAKP